MSFTYTNGAPREGAGRQNRFCKDHSALNSEFKNAVQEPFAELYIGGRRTGVTIQRDALFPRMWRVRHGDELSDITNISRAKDAAITWARPRGLGGDEVARWHHRESRTGAPLVRQTGRGRT